MSPYAIPGIRLVGAVTFEDIEDVVCTFYSVPITEVYSKTRRHSRQASYCRFLIGFFAVEFMGLSLVSIAEHIGCHHTSVMYGRRVVHDRKHTEQMFSAEVEEMRRRIHERRMC